MVNELVFYSILMFALGFTIGMWFAYWIIEQRERRMNKRAFDMLMKAADNAFTKSQLKGASNGRRTETN